MYTLCCILNRLCRCLHFSIQCSEDRFDSTMLFTFFVFFFREKGFIGLPRRLVPRRCLRSASSDVLSLRFNRAEAAIETPDIRCRYIDCVSMFPHLMSSELFPCGPYQVLVGDMTKALKRQGNEFFYQGKVVYGLAFCYMQAPPSLSPDAPTLMFQSPLSGRMIKSLCRSCALSLNKNFCEHEGFDRLLEVECTFEDLKQSLVDKYTLFSFKEAYIFTEAKKIGGSFFPTLIRAKLVASGNESGGVLSDEQYASKLNEEMGYHGDLKIQPGELIANPIQRQLVKSILVSCLGNMGRRLDYPNLITVDNLETLQRLLEYRTVLSLTPVGEEWVVVSVKAAAKSKDYASVKFNVVLASYLTSYARSWMRRQVRAISNHPGASVLSYECDSVLYLESASNPVTELDWGYSMGKCRNVIPGAEIVSYHSLGTKAIHLAYIQDNKLKHLTRLRGLNCDNSMNISEICTDRKSVV